MYFLGPSTFGKLAASLKIFLSVMKQYEKTCSLLALPTTISPK